MSTVQCASRCSVYHGAVCIMVQCVSRCTVVSVFLDACLVSVSMQRQASPPRCQSRSSMRLGRCHECIVCSTVCSIPRKMSSSALFTVLYAARIVPPHISHAALGPNGLCNIMSTMSMQYAVCSVQLVCSTVCSIPRPMYNHECAVYSVQRAVYYHEYAVCSVQYAAQYVVYLCTIMSVQCKVSTV